jgi:hypothetical protein
VRRDCFPRFCRDYKRGNWIPACAGMTEKGRNDIKTFICMGFRKNMGTGFTFCLALNARGQKKTVPAYYIFMIYLTRIKIIL